MVKFYSYYAKYRHRYIEWNNELQIDGNMCQIEELLADIEKGADLGPEISQNVAESFLKTISRQLSKESKAKLRETLKTPSNCKQFSPPKINNEIWKIIPSQARLQDNSSPSKL